MRSYNLFWRKGAEGLCCAVPESCAVPSFVVGGRWAYGGRLAAPGDAPGGFDPHAADTAVRFNGFYLFQTVDRRLA
ncbi:hypothetical protein [Methylobacterium sp. A54F]